MLFKPRFGHSARSAATVSLSTSSSPATPRISSPRSSPSNTPPSTPPPHNPQLYAFRLHCRTEAPHLLDSIESCFDCPTHVDSILDQFLRFHKGQLRPALTQLLTYWAFRTDRLGLSHSASAPTFSHAVSVALSTGPDAAKPFVNVPGTSDLDGRTVVTMTMAKLAPVITADPSGLLTARRVWTNLEKLLLCSPKFQWPLQTKGICIVLDMRGMGMLNGEKMTLELLIDAIQNRFPIKLGAFYLVHPPTWVSLMWSVVRRAMKPKLLKRVHVVPTVSQLYAHLPPDRLPQELGGKIALNQLE